MLQEHSKEAPDTNRSVNDILCVPGAELRFASYFADHMVLQKGPAGAVLWGYGEPSANIMAVVYQGNHVVMKKMVQTEGNYQML